MKGIKEGQAVYWTDPYTHECNVYSVLRVPPQDSEDNIIVIGNPWTEKEVWESELTLVNGLVRVVNTSNGSRVFNSYNAAYKYYFG